MRNIVPVRTDSVELISCKDNRPQSRFLGSGIYLMSVKLLFDGVHFTRDVLL